MDRAPRSPRRGERLASSAADEEVVEGSPDLLAIAALEDLRVDPGRWVLLETISAAGEPWYNLAPRSEIMRAAIPTAKADYPTKLVRMIEPFGPGSGPEVVATAVGRKLAELWGQPVTVENHPGAGSTAAPAMVATSPADGYTLLVHTNAHAYSAALVTNLPYDPLTDFVPVAALTTQSYVLVAGKTAGLATVGALIAAARAKPGQLRFGSTGVGTGTHLGIEKFNLAAGINATHVPARGSDAIADTIANTIARRTDYALSPIPTTLPHIHAGRLLALGLSSARRSTALPDVPTVAEAGVPGFDFPIWYGIWAPGATPAGVVQTLAEDIARALSDPGVRASLVEHGGEPMSMTQLDFTRFVLRESESAARIIEAAGIKPQ
jgi:tripartite-type tricarboxylate transporter receptor subunit TctC